MSKYSFTLLLLCATLFASSGCTKDVNLKGLVPASGKVTFDGKTVENATVSFYPVEQTADARPANGTTDANGAFTLTTLQPNDGIFPGEYKVVVRKLEIKYLTDDEYNAALAAGNPPSGPESKDLLPKKYIEVDTTPLSVSIGEKGDKNIVLDLEK